jgi:uncharacterized membrane protein YjdF
MRFHTGMYISAILVYIASLIYNANIGSPWWIDAALTMVFLTVMFLLRHHLMMGKLEFSLLNLGLLFHNLGTFGFYEWSYGWLGYDNIIHFLGAAITAFIAANFVYKRLSFRLRLRKYDDSKIIAAALAIGLVMLLGAGIELLEYVGYTVLDIEGSSVGLMGIGDTNEYLDTINDLVTNLVGAIAGMIIYYISQYRKG